MSNLDPFSSPSLALLLDQFRRPARAPSTYSECAAPIGVITPLMPRHHYPLDSFSSLLLKRQPQCQ